MYYDTSGNYIGYEQEFFKIEVRPVLITFTTNGAILQAMAKVYNDAYYQIVTGEHKDCFVHVNKILH